jgi:SAM-dependent methyltransferase
MPLITIEDLFIAWKTIIKENEKKPYFPEYDYFFRKKYNDLKSVEKINKKVRNWATLFSSHKISLQDKKVLVVGCGAGIECLFFCLLGAQEITAVEIDNNFIQGIKAYLKDIGIKLPIKPLLHDIHIINNNDFYDVVLTIDTISHLYDYKKFIQTSFSLLKSKGNLFIMDDNNLLNIKRQKQLVKIWEKWEKEGSEYIMEDGQKKRVNSYREDRYFIIKEKYQSLPEEEINKLTDGTAGLRPLELYEAVNNYIKNGIFPHNFYEKGMIAYDTKQDMPKERPFNPYILAKEIEQIGFENVRHLPGLVRKSSILRRIYCGLLIIFKPLTYKYLSIGFSISAKKS